MKRTLIAGIVGVCLLTAGVADAWLPAGADWLSWPYMYSSETGTWYYLYEGDAQFVFNFSTRTWSRLGPEELHTGWLYVEWPYAYSFQNSTWYYFDTDGLQAVYNQTFREWSQLGESMIHGTWYDEGHSGGWGPRGDYYFGWFYFERAGAQVWGRYEYEFYYQGRRYDQLREIHGVATGDQLSFSVFNTDGSLHSTWAGRVSDGFFHGTCVYASTQISLVQRLDRLTPAIQRRANP